MLVAHTTAYRCVVDRRSAVIVVVALIAACGGSQPRRISAAPTTSLTPATVAVSPNVESRYRAAAAAVTLFHLRFDQRSFGRIYAAADDSLRAASTEAAFTARLGALRDRVG